MSKQHQREWAKEWQKLEKGEIKTITEQHNNKSSGQNSKSGIDPVKNDKGRRERKALIFQTENKQ